ncbi:MAG: sigma-54-dependent transcriptional regulator [Fusobacteriota bacterium]
MEKYKVLIIDDNKHLRYSLKKALSIKKEYLIEESSNGKDGIDLYKKNKHDIIITDLVMENMNGLEVIETVKQINSEAILILITGNGTENIAAKAIKKGAYDYFSKPFNYDDFFKTMRNAKEKIDFIREKKQYMSIIEDENKFFNLHYASPEMKEVVKKIKKYSRFGGNILILGESGVGKELIAECIYLSSERKNKPFIKINCSAIPEDLIESELFGYKKGSFTGAFSSKKGKLEIADKGTVFLDEIGDLNINVQSKFLRTLEDGGIEKIGASSTKKVDINVIAATNIDLNKKVKEEKFRLDLFYRLNTFKIDIPPLRERKEDIIFLSNIFLDEFCKKFNLPTKKISNPLKKKLLNYRWPGNIRELKNVIQNFIVLGEDEEILEEKLFKKVIQKNIYSQKFDPNIKSNSLKEFLKLKEKEYLKAMLEDSGDNKSLLAKKVGLSRTSLYNKLNEYKLIN